MITDNMLAAAAQEAALCMTGGISEEPHSFSQRFQRKIARLTRRADHPVLYRATQAAAAAVLVLVTIFGALIALSPQVRAAVVGWMRSTVGNWFEYSVVDTTPPGVTYEYILPETFHGYTLWVSIDGDYGITYFYTNEDGHSIQFDYTCGSDAPLYVDVEGAVYEPGYVDSFPADIYISHDDGRNSVVIWQDQENRVLCYLAMIADRETLIEIAEEIETYNIIIE